MKYVLFYEYADGAGPQANLHFSSHRTWFEDYHHHGALLMIGHLAGSPQSQVMAVFTTRDAAEAFAAGDPYVLQGVVRSWRIRAWDEVLDDIVGADRNAG